MEAFNDLMLRQRDLGSVLPKLGALVGFGVAYLLLGARLYESRRIA
jgi:hypothetical protein